MTPPRRIASGLAGRTGHMASVLATLLATLLAGLTCGACVNDGQGPREQPRPLPKQPATLVATRLVFSVGVFSTDADNNGRADTFDVSVYLFDENYQYAIAVPGTLIFTLADKNGKTLARWTFEPERSAKLVKQLPPGWGYSIQLSLLDVGGDEFESQTAEFACEFVPSNGPAVRSRNRPAVQIGKIR